MRECVHCAQQRSIWINICYIHSFNSSVNRFIWRIHNGMLYPLIYHLDCIQQNVNTCVFLQNYYVSLSNKRMFMAITRVLLRYGYFLRIYISPACIVHYATPNEYDYRA